MSARIMYVEDNPENQLLVRRVLEAEGYEILVANDGLEGIRMAQEVLPDLILMDINLPGMDGYAATTRIKSFEPLRDVPVVALTANVMQGDRERSLAAGCDGYLQKPIDIDRLVDAVAEYLRGKREQMPQKERLEYVEQYASKLVGELERRIEALQGANAELRELDRMKSEFVSTVSHELRTPLNIIIGHGEVLEDELFGPLNEHQRRYVSNIVSSSRHLYDLVQDILDLSKIESGQLSLNRQRLPLGPLLDELRGLLEPLAQRKQIALTFEVAPAIEQVAADRLRLRQIIQNLISNAIKFTPDGGRVACRVSRPEPAALRIEVEDSGIGIAPEEQERIFERFRQVDSSASREGEGTGLGLTLTREFVQLHGGTITLQSTPGQGSLFTVTLPQEASPPTA